MNFPKTVRTESRIEIYQFEMYDLISDRNVLSKRWGTSSKIQSICGRIIQESKRLVDASAVRSDIDGLTEIGYVPSDDDT